jgi:photosystem II stability/assembly factor-like uncharacterized protein
MRRLLWMLLLIPVMGRAQGTWDYLPNAPVMPTGRFDDLYFVNDSTGWAVNADGKIYRTTDHGESWTLQFDNAVHYFRSVEFLDDQHGLVGALDSTVYRTTDGGMTWAPIDLGLAAPLPGVCGIGHHGQTVIMVGIWSQPAFLVRSTDGGSTWTHQDMSQLAGGLIDCWFKGPDTVFVCGRGTNATGAHGIILRSTDAGLTWQQVGQSVYANTYCWKLQFTSPSVGYSSCETSTASDSRIMKTVDGGATWTTMPVVNTNISMEGIGFVNDSVGWVGGWSTGMYHTVNGGASWTYLNMGQNLNRYFFLSPGLGYASGRSVYRYTALVTGSGPAPDTRPATAHRMHVYPGPTTGPVNIDLDLLKSTRVLLEVYDQNGSMVMELINARTMAGPYHQKVDLSHLPQGNYFFVLRTNEHFLTRQLTLIARPGIDP